MMSKFKEEQKKNIETLEQYVPVVDKVHGENHPEFHSVRKLFDEINKQIQERDYTNLTLDDEFEALRRITSAYKIPSDTCETYEAVYLMLSDLDKSYSATFSRK